MLRFIRSLFTWHVHHERGVWSYSVNAVTGRRKADRINIGGHSPLDWEWLLAGEGVPLIGGVEAWRSSYRNDLPDGWYWG